MTALPRSVIANVDFDATMAFWNCRSIRSKLKQKFLQYAIDTNNTQKTIICLAESWLDNDITTTEIENNFEQMKLFRNDRKTDKKLEE